MEQHCYILLGSLRCVRQVTNSADGPPLPGSSATAPLTPSPGPSRKLPGMVWM